MTRKGGRGISVVSGRVGMYGSANDKYRYTYFLINKLTKEDLSLLYFYVFQYTFIDLVHFLALLLCPCHMTKP